MARETFDEVLQRRDGYTQEEVDEARQEILDPRRTVTSTVKTEKSMSHRLPVKTVPEVPKDMIAAVMSEIHKIRVAPPVHINDVIARNIAGTGSDLVATDNLLR